MPRLAPRRRWCRPSRRLTNGTGKPGCPTAICRGFCRIRWIADPSPGHKKSGAGPEADSAFFIPIWSRRLEPVRRHLQRGGIGVLQNPDPGIYFWQLIAAEVIAGLEIAPVEGRRLRATRRQSGRGAQTPAQPEPAHHRMAEGFQVD